MASKLPCNPFLPGGLMDYMAYFPYVRKIPGAVKFIFIFVKIILDNTY